MKVISLVLGLIAFAGNCLAQSQDDEPFTLGNPVVRKALLSTTLSLTSGSYAIIYSPKSGSPLLAAWHLGQADFGLTDRYEGLFFGDRRLPANIYRASDADFDSTGFDRGHLVPSADRTANLTAQKSTFLLTNVLAQRPKLNQQTWKNLEAYIRKLVKLGAEAYQFAGGWGESGRIGRNAALVVPAYCWKVIVLLPAGTGDIVRLKTGKGVRVIAVWIPNQPDVHPNWQRYIVPPCAIEELTGFKFFMALPPAVRRVLTN